MEETGKKRMPKKLKIFLIVLASLPVLIAAAVAVTAVIVKVQSAARYRELSSVDLVAAIDMSSVQQVGDEVHFTVSLESGETLRFVGEGVRIEEGKWTFEPGGRVTALDAIGAVHSYSVVVTENQDRDNFLEASGGFTFSDAVAVNAVSELECGFGYGIYAWEAEDTEENRRYDDPGTIWMERFYPNFPAYGNNAYSPASFALTSLKVNYDPDTKTTRLASAQLYDLMCPRFVEGDRYRPEIEDMWTDSPDGPIPALYLLAVPEGTEVNEEDPISTSVWCIRNFTVGALRDAEGAVLDKHTARVTPGTTLDITIGDQTLPVQLLVSERFRGGSTMNDLVPYVYPEASGELPVLVVPVCWADQPHMATDAELELYRSALGRVESVDGTRLCDDSADDGTVSFTEYYDAASYGALQLRPVMTDWYHSEQVFAGDMEYLSVEASFADEVLAWVKATYPELDLSQFDRDGNGYVDSMIIINAGETTDDTLYMGTYGYGIFCEAGYTGERAGSKDDPTVNTFLSLNRTLIEETGASIIVHEFAHNLGLIDYYDVTYSGIAAVGGFDMQDANHGDWNAYSKWAVGWLEPTVVQLASGESAEYELNALAAQGDVLVIPAAGSEPDGPFGEYIMVDLFSAEGLNAPDAHIYGLDGVSGVRVYHVNATMEKHVEYGADGKEYIIGTIQYPNAYAENGLYNIELIQAGGVNTLTDGLWEDNTVDADDLFYAGDSFSLATHGAFFADGLMDDGSDFGYVIEVVSIADGKAVVRVTAQ